MSLLRCFGGLTKVTSQAAPGVIVIGNEKGGAGKSTIALHVATALLNRGYMGEAHLVWGSFAFMDDNSAWPNTRQLFERTTAGIPDTFRGRLAGENCARLYGLGNAGRFTPEEVKAYDSYALL